jgi:hypothetical protein
MAYVAMWIPKSLPNYQAFLKIAVFVVLVDKASTVFASLALYDAAFFSLSLKVTTQFIAVALAVLFIQ